MPFCCPLLYRLLRCVWETWLCFEGVFSVPCDRRSICDCSFETFAIMVLESSCIFCFGAFRSIDRESSLGAFLAWFDAAVCWVLPMLACAAPTPPVTLCCFLSIEEIYCWPLLVAATSSRELCRWLIVAFCEDRTAALGAAVPLPFCPPP